MGQQWPAAGLGALSVAVSAWDLLKGVVIIYITSTIVSLLSHEVTQLCRRTVDCDPVHCSHQAPLSMGFSRQEYWSGLPLPSPGDLPHPGIKTGSPAL